MFKIYDIKGVKVPIVVEESDDDKSYLYLAVGLVCLEKRKGCKTPTQEIIDNESDLILSIYEGTTKKIIQRSDEEFVDIVFKYFYKYVEKLDVVPSDIIIEEFNLRALGYTDNNGVILINKHMKYLAEEIIEVTVYHELCHIYAYQKHGTLAHDEHFYNIFTREYTKEQEKQLLSNYSN